MLLITGASGWLGLSLATYVAKHGEVRDQEIRLLVLPGTDTEKLSSILPKAKIFQGDIRDRTALQKFCEGARGANLIHISGVIHPKRISEFYEINSDGTKRTLESAASAGISRAVIVSSNSPCGCNPHRDHLFDEDSPYNPYLNYGRSKMNMELHALEMHNQGLIEVVVVRAPWFYGPNQPPRQKLFFNMIRDGKVPIVGDGENLRSMAYTENLAQGLLLAIRVPRAAGQIYWIADRRPYSMNEIVDTVERLLETEFGQKCSHKRLYLPSLISEIAFLMDACIQQVGAYHQKIHVLSEMNKTIACSVDKAEKELGFHPEIELEEGMRRSLEEIFKN